MRTATVQEDPAPLGAGAVDRKTVTSAVDVLLETVTRAVAKGERVVLTGFGSFEKKDKPARTGRNPQPVPPST